jgi:hypothetical protein
MRPVGEKWLAARFALCFASQRIAAGPLLKWLGAFGDQRIAAGPLSAILIVSNLP